jgi:hypothetical protein
MNGGGSVSCSMAVAMRDDDVGLLSAMAWTTGVGVVRHKDQRGNPQAEWVVYRKDDAVALAAYLRRFQLRIRKRHDFEIWNTAVGFWRAGGKDRLPHMVRLSRSIREARRYGTTTTIAVPDELVLVGFYEWLGGFIAGDGHLGAAAGATRLTIRLRADDRALLAALARTTGMGTIRGPYQNRAASPSTVWNVTRTSDLLALTERLDGKIPGRKRLEFDVWRRAVLARADRDKPASDRRRIIDEAERELRRLRTYRPGAALPSANSRRVQRMYQQNKSWLGLLREWAAGEQGALTATAYNEARRAGWPTRNTIAIRFGSWYDALAAAGLSQRAAVLPEVRDARTRGGADPREARRIAQQQRVAAAVRRCATALARSPGPTEYARWRLHNDPAAPAVPTCYRLFPGGWSELQAACVPSA